MIFIHIDRLLALQICTVREQHKTEDIPTTVVWRKYICPVYPISRTTLYEILCTAVTIELKKVEDEIKKQTKN